MSQIRNMQHCEISENGNVELVLPNSATSEP